MHIGQWPGVHRGRDRKGLSMVNLIPTVKQSKLEVNPKANQFQQTIIQEPKSSSHPEAKSQEAVNLGVESRPKPHCDQKSKVLPVYRTQRREAQI